MGDVAAVVLDLDGVVRHFDPDHEPDLCRRHGLEPGTILRAVFASAATEAAVTGAMTRAEWLAAVGEEVGLPEAVAAWGEGPATVDEDVLAVVDEVRSTGRPVVILTNGTDTIDEELAALELASRFDAVFNSAVIGHAKPDVRAFRHVVDALDLPSERVAFADDSPAKLAGAVELGMPALAFTDAASLRAWLVTLGALA